MDTSGDVGPDLFWRTPGSRDRVRGPVVEGSVPRRGRPETVDETVTVLPTLPIPTPDRGEGPLRQPFRVFRVRSDAPGPETPCREPKRWSKPRPCLSRTKPESHEVRGSQSTPSFWGRVPTLDNNDDRRVDDTWTRLSKDFCPPLMSERQHSAHSGPRDYMSYH